MTSQHPSPGDASVLTPSVHTDVSDSQRFSQTSEPSRIPELDGLRGIAILSVVAYHYAVLGPSSPFYSVLYELRALFRLGWAGVDLFFVLSGFLIGGILLKAKASPRYYQTFYARRTFRILPIYYLWVCLFPLGVFVYSRWGLPKLFDDPHAFSRLPLYIIFMQTFVYPFLPAVRTVGYYWLGPTWSVAIEEQFYIVAAPLVRILSRQKLTYALWGTIVLCPLLRLFMYLKGFTIFAFVMPCRADSFAMGILVAMSWETESSRKWLIDHRKWVYGTLAVLSLGPPIFTKWFTSNDSLSAAIFELQCLSAFFACLILTVLINRTGMISRLLRWSFLREMGRLSYCIYLIHLSVIAGCYAWLMHSEPRVDNALSFITIGVSALLTYALAWLSFRYFEGPLLKLGHRFKY